MEQIPGPAMFLFALTYTLAFISLAIGLLLGIWHLIWLAMSGQAYTQEVVDLRMAFLSVAGYVAALGTIIALPFTVIRLRLNAQQTKTAEDALFNDKINAAATDLAARRTVTTRIIDGNTESILSQEEDDLVTRAAAIDRLEGLAAERPDDAPRIARMLAIYVRLNSPCESLEPTQNLEIRARPRADIQQAITVSGQVLKMVHDHNPQLNLRLDLSNSNLDGISLEGGYFLAVNLRQCRLEAAILDDADLTGAFLQGCLLNHARFRRTKLIGAKLDHIALNQPVTQPGGFSMSINLAEIHGVTLIGADIRAIDYLGSPETISATFATADTQVSDELSEQMPHMQDRRYFCLHSDASKVPDDRKADYAKYLESGFKYWLPYDSSDLAIGRVLPRFKTELGLIGWPYE